MNYDIVYTRCRYALIYYWYHTGRRGRCIKTVFICCLQPSTRDC